MNAKSKRLLATAMSAVFAAGIATCAWADETQWQKDHPRRAEVNKRLANQNRRIHHEVKEGDLTEQQAAQLHKEDHQIRHQQRQMASRNGGHITRQEQRTLNREENAVSKQIGK